jgi:hypothetical protein
MKGGSSLDLAKPSADSLLEYTVFVGQDRAPYSLLSGSVFEVVDLLLDSGHQIFNIADGRERLLHEFGSEWVTIAGVLAPSSRQVDTLRRGMRLHPKYMSSYFPRFEDTIETPPSHIPARSE